VLTPLLTAIDGVWSAFTLTRQDVDEEKEEEEDARCIGIVLTLG
jgi:hypothetical protein